MAEAPCRAAFAARLREALDAFEAMQLEAARQRIVAQLTPLLAAAPGREFDASDFADKNAETAQYIANRPAEIRAGLAARGF
jgi:hypothetical protein